MFENIDKLESPLSSEAHGVLDPLFENIDKLESPLSSQ